MTRALRYLKQSTVGVPAEALYDWHMRPGAFERLTPPWQRIEIVEAEPPAEGSRATLRLRHGPLTTRWVAEHRDIVPGEGFEDVQIAGPFAEWRHRHRFVAVTDETSVLRDRIDYRPPGGRLGALLAGRSIRRTLERTFDYRHRTTRDDVMTHDRYRARQPLTVAISGAGGFVGSALVPLLTGGGHEVVRLVRGASAGAGEARWSTDEGLIEPEALTGVDAVVHLAGENIAGGRWTERRKQRIRESRVDGTRRLAESLARLDGPPATLLCASAIGFYGDRGDELLNEESTAGRGFLADTCQEWEAASRPAVEAGIRVAHARFGVVLSPQGGALAKMLTPFRLGAGGVIGSGRQYMSWISLDDAASALLHILMTQELSGAINLTAASPVTNREFTKTLGRVLRRPTIAPMPAFAARLAFGEMADEMLLAGARVQPAKLLASGFEHRHPELEGALRHLLGRAA